MELLYYLAEREKAWLNVTGAADQVIEDSSTNGVPDKFLSILQLQTSDTSTPQLDTKVKGQLTSMSGLNRSSNVAMAAKEPDPA